MDEYIKRMELAVQNAFQAINTLKIENSNLKTENSLLKNEINELKSESKRFNNNVINRYCFYSFKLLKN
jgi:FtsZ-binding cell division protein ZapB